jgi:hypothetical protein
MAEMGEDLQRAIRRRIVEYHQDLDETAQKAEQMNCGIKVVWGEGLSYEMMASREIPLGEIREYHP